MKELIKIIPTLTIKDWIGGIFFMIVISLFLYVVGYSEDMNGLNVSYLGRI